MNYLLDTNAVSALMRQNAKILNRIGTLPGSDRALVSSITRGEILFGLERLAPGRGRSELTTAARYWLGYLTSLPAGDDVADRYAALKREAQRLGTPLDENDLWIAATALTAGAVIVTTDQDFARIPRLQTEDWTR